MQFSDLADHPEIAKILYAPVDVGASVPNVPYDKLYQWALATQAQRKIEHDLAFPPGTQTKVNVCIVPDYESEGILQGPLFDGVFDGWYGGFDTHFPEVVEYLKLFPFTKPAIGIRLTDGMHPSLQLEKYPHTDVDVEVVTMRVFLVLDEVKRLNFREIKAPYKRYHYSRLGAGDAIPLHHLWPKKHYANTLRNPHAWVLGNIGSPHAVDHEGVEGRCVLKITGEWDIPRAIEMFQHSLTHYSDHVLSIDTVNEHGSFNYY